MDVKFPLNNGQRYWSIHYLYVLNIFKHLKYNISFRDMSDRGNAFIVGLNGKDFLFDYADSATVAETSLPTFKFHCNVVSDKVYPFPPVSFYDWDKYEELVKTIKYNPACDHFSYRTQAYGNARERRTTILNMVQPLGNVVTGMIPQNQFFQEISQIKAYIHVDGHHVGMIDRSVSQMFALGCPVITSYKPDLLPYGATWDLCYILVDNDYNNLIPKLSTLKEQNLIAVGERAKYQFKTYCTPQAIDKYLKEIVCGI